MKKLLLRPPNYSARRGRVPVSGVLIAGVVVFAPAFARSQNLNLGVGVDDLDKLCRAAQAADEQERVLVSERKSPALDGLQSETAFWTFLIDPSTSYLDRMAAAHQGSNLVVPELLPRLWEAYALFETLPYGVNPSPCEFIYNAWGARSPSAWASRKAVPIPGTVSPKAEVRNLLGFDIHLPNQAIDYPLDVATRMNSPWVWQMWRALSALRTEVGRYYSQPGRYEAMVEVAFSWHPMDFYARNVRASAIQFGPRNAAWVEAQVRLILETQGDADAGSSALNIYAGNGDSDHMKALVATAWILILQQTHNPGIAHWSAYELASLGALQRRWPSAWKTLPTASSVLAIAEWYQLLPKDFPALDKELADAWGEPGSPFKFEEWVERERPRLEAAATEELPTIRALAAEMHQQAAPIPASYPKNR